MFLRLWNYIRGYVVIKVQGFNIERFINLAAHKGIYLWDVTYMPDGTYMKVSTKGFKMLKSCVRKTKCKIKIVSKTGYPFFAHKYRKRKVLISGLIFFIFSLYFLSSFIWLVEVEGNDRIHTDKIILFFNEQNIKVGGFKYIINKKEAEKLFLNEFSDASWVNVSVKGTRATIRLTETIPKQDIIDRSTPCDVIAKKDGIITSIVTSAGTPLKKELDVALKGEVLVSGELVIKDDETGRITQYTHAEAAVVAKTYYEIKFFTPFIYEDRIYTNNSKKIYFISLFGKKIKLNPFKSSISYASYDKITFRNQLRFSEDYPLPIILITEEYREFKPVVKKYTLRQAEETAERIIISRIVNEFDFGIDIIDKRVDYEETPEGLKVEAKITALERIDFQAEKGLMPDEPGNAENQDIITEDM